MSIASMAKSPTALVLVGRAVAQAGFFAFTIAPSFVLDDQDYNDLVVGVTVLVLAVTAPVAAFQLHLVRLEHALTSVRDAYSKSLRLAVVCAAIACVLLVSLTDTGLWTIPLVVGAIASVVPSLGASLHARADRFGRSAIVDAASGMGFVAAVAVLIVADAPLTGWAWGYGAAWVFAAAVTIASPLRVRRIGPATSAGPLTRLMRDAWAMIAIGVVAMAFNRADYLVLSLVAPADEVTRYALATRFVGPVLIALGSLNNSLYVRQVALRDDPAELRRLTARTAKRVGALALASVPLLVLAVALLQELSPTLAARELVVPTALLAVATVPFAFAIPSGFGLAAVGRETTWLSIMAVATLVDAAAVAALGSNGAVTAAGLWVATQLSVLVAVRYAWARGLGSMPHAAA